MAASSAAAAAAVSSSSNHDARLSTLTSILTSLASAVSPMLLSDLNLCVCVCGVC